MIAAVVISAICGPPIALITLDLTGKLDGLLTSVRVTQRESER